MSDNPYFQPNMSSDEIYLGQNVSISLTDEVNNKAEIDHTHDEYALQVDLDTLETVVDSKANSTHVHTEYVSSDVIATLEDTVDTKADANHTHTEYASSSHTHDGYVVVSDFDNLELEVDGKANVNHTHNNYSEIEHTHTNYATITSLNEVSAVVSGKANVSHSHDDTYYTETEVDTLLSGKANSSHTHENVYDVSGAAANALSSANSYTDSKIDALVGEGASTTLDTIGEISSAIEDSQDAIDLLNSAIGNKANTTHIHAIADVTNLQTILDNKSSVTHVHTASDVGAATSGHNHNDVYYTEAEVDSLLAAKSDSTHTHDYVPTSRTVNGKALSSDISLSASDVGALPSDTDIPSALSDLTTDSNHRLVTDTEKSTWNAKSNFSGDYNDLTNKPSIPSISGLATETYVDEALEDKADSSHVHTISNITNLQSILDEKATSGHTHDVATTSANGLMSTSDKSKLDGMVLATISEVETYLGI